MNHIFAVESADELSAYQDFVRSIDVKLHSYIAALRDQYAVNELPKTIVWTSKKIATELISDIPVPAYTNDHRIVITPDLNTWKQIYLSQLDGLSGDTVDLIREYYNTALTNDHILQILGHELAHHSSYFPDSDYQSGIWFEEGMVEYISRRWFLSDQEYDEMAHINRLLVELLTPKYGNHPLEDFGAETYSGNYGSIFFEYWRSFLAVQSIVDACNGDILFALKRGIHHEANACREI